MKWREVGTHADAPLTKYGRYDPGSYLAQDVHKNLLDVVPRRSDYRGHAVTPANSRPFSRDASPASSNSLILEKFMPHLQRAWVEYSLDRLGYHRNLPFGVVNDRSNRDHKMIR